MTPVSNRLPGPPGRLLLGNLTAYRRDMLAFLQRCAADYDSPCGFRLATMRCCLVSDPAQVTEILQTRNDQLIKPWDLRQLKIVLGDGLLTNEGNAWRRQRKQIQPAFHTDRVAAYAAVMVAQANATVASWRDGEVRDVHADMMALTLDIVARCLFGANVGDTTETVARALGIILDRFTEVLERGLPIPFWLPTPGNRRMHKAIHALDDVIYRFIADRRASEDERDDLLGLLLAPPADADRGMDDRQLRDEVMTLFLAGHETTALALTWTLHLLSRHASIAAQVAQELDAVLLGRLPAARDVDRLPVLNRVLRESLRLYPPAWGIGREVARSFELAGYTLKRGTQVFMLPFLMHRDARYFPDPERFDPDRWTPEFTHALPKYAFFPFGGGPRFCVGAGFAMTEACLLLAVILQRFTVAPVPEHPIELQFAVTLRPRHGLKLMLRRR